MTKGTQGHRRHRLVARPAARPRCHHDPHPGLAPVGGPHRQRARAGRPGRHDAGAQARLVVRGGLRAAHGRAGQVDHAVRAQRPQLLRRQHPHPGRPDQRLRADAGPVVRLLEGRRRQQQAGLRARRHHQGRPHRSDGRPGRGHLLVLHDALQRGPALGPPDGRARQPLLLHQPLPGGPRRDRVEGVVRRRADDELPQ